MRRRDFIALGGAGLIWPGTAQTQQPTLPVIGFLNGQSPLEWETRMLAFRRGLSEMGYFEHRNLGIEYRWAQGQNDRLPGFAADLVRRAVSVIVATGSPASALAAKAATNTIPIVFTTGADPVALGLVASFNRPGGNLTGVNSLIHELGSKRLELLHELVPAAKTVGLLLNPVNASAEPDAKDLQTAARVLGLQLHIENASTEREIEAAFARLAQRRIEILFVASDAFFGSQRDQLIALAALNAMPASYQARDDVAAGGLMSYGVTQGDMYRQLGLYAGRILKGERPADLPVVQPTRFGFVINLKTAKTLALDVPAKLLALADEVIE